MSVSFKVENVQISAERDRAMFNTFAGNKSYVIEGIGDELEVSYASNSFIVQLGTGEAVICGGSMISEGELDTITLNPNENGYLVVRVDLSQTGTNQCRFYSTPTIVQGNINSGTEYIYDLPLYQYQTSNEGVQNMNDIRDVLSSLLGGATFSVENGYVWVTYEVNGQTVKKKLGSLDPATLTATPQNVLSGKIFGGAGTDEAQTGTMPDKTKIDSSIGAINASYPNVSVHKGSHLQMGTTTISRESLISLQAPEGYYYGAYVGTPSSNFGTASKSEVVSGKTFTSTEGVKVSGTFAAQTRTVNPSNSSQDIVADSGKYLSKVTVSAIPNKTQSVTVTYTQTGGELEKTFTFGNLTGVLGVVGMSCTQERQVIAMSISGNTVKLKMKSNSQSSVTYNVTLTARGY